MGGVLKVATIGEPPTLDMPMSTATITLRDHVARQRDAVHLRRQLQPGPAPGRHAHHHRGWPPPHHHAAQGRQVPQRQGDDLRRRRALAQALGPGRLAGQVAVGQRREHRGQGRLHRRALAQAAVRLAAVRPGRAARRHLSQGSHRGGRRRAAQGVHRHRARIASSSTSPTVTSSWRASRTTSRAASRPAASAASASPTSTRSCSSRCRTPRCGWPAWRPASTTTACS